MFDTITIIDVLDVLILATLIYQVLVIFQRTRASQLILGFLYFVLLFSIAYVAHMMATLWVFERLAIILPVALLVIFQPELRSFLQRAGRRGLLFRMSRVPEAEDIGNLIDTVVQALEEMSEDHTGAIIVFEREIGLNEYINTGERIDARVRKDLLKAIFFKNNPLHDGAVIIRGDRIASARSFLPLSDSRDIPSHLGTRHRSALGITEGSDAVSFVASEETGHLSLYNAGRPAFRLTPVTLRHMAREIILPESGPETGLFNIPVSFGKWSKLNVKKERETEKGIEGASTGSDLTDKPAGGSDTDPAAEQTASGAGKGGDVE